MLLVFLGITSDEEPHYGNAELVVEAMQSDDDAFAGIAMHSCCGGVDEIGHGCHGCSSACCCHDRRADGYDHATSNSISSAVFRFSLTPMTSVSGFLSGHELLVGIVIAIAHLALTTKKPQRGIENASGLLASGLHHFLHHHHDDCCH